MGGSIHKNTSGHRYHIDVYWEGRNWKIRQDKNGKPFYHPKQAAKTLSIIQTEIDEKSFHPRYWMPGNPMKVSEYTEEWLGAITASKKTVRDYRGYFNNHINPAIGNMDIRTIRHKHLAKLYRDINLSDKGRYNVMGALKAMLRWAYRNEDISRVPPFPVLKVQAPAIRYLTYEQQHSVLEQIPDWDRPIFIVGMEYGLRVGEVRALQKDSVDETTITIQRAFSDNDLREKTKTSEVRYYEITERASEALSMAPDHIGLYVFVRKRDYKPYTNKNLNMIWRKACAKAGITIKLYNAFRHSLGCQLLDQGEDLALVQDVLGHARPDMTRRYAKRSNTGVTSALARRGKLFSLHNHPTLKNDSRK